MKFDKQNLISQSAINLISRISILLTALIFYPIVSRILSKEEIAIIAVFEFLPPLIDFLPNLGFQTTIMKLLPEKKNKNMEEAKLLVQINTYLIQAIFLLLVIIVIIFSRQVSFIFLKRIKYSSNIILIAIWSFIFTLSDRLLIVKQALGEYYFVSYFNMFRYVFSRIFAIICVILGYGVSGIIIAFIVIFSISMFIAGKSIKDFLFPIVLVKYRYKINGLIKYSFPFYLQGLSRYLASYLDQPLIGFLFKPDVLSAYFLIKKIVFTLIIFNIEAIREPLVPKLLNLLSFNKIVDMYNLYYRFTSFLNFLVLTGLVIIGSNSSKILYIFAGEQFRNYYTYFFPFFIYIFASHIFNNLNVIVFVTKSPVWSFYSFFISGVINIIVSLILGYLFGIKWFIVGQSLGFFIVVFVLLTKYKIVDVKNTDIKKTFLIFFVIYSTLILISQNISNLIRSIYSFSTFSVLIIMYWRYIKDTLILYYKKSY